MKNYSEIQLHEELSASQENIVGAGTRIEWIQSSFEESVIPAITGVSKAQDESQGAAVSQQPGAVQPSEDEIVARLKVERFAQALPIEDVERVIDMVDSITRMPCGCRFVTTGKTNQRYCFGLGIDKWGVLGKFPDAASSLEVLDKEEARRILRKYDEEGLVHSIWSYLPPYIADICNCDRDCLPYNAHIVKGGAPSFFRGEYICQVDWDLCMGCKSCMSQCQFGAQFYSSALAKVHIHPAKCFGCAVCRAVCPQEAIKLIPRQHSPEAANVWLR